MSRSDRGRLRALVVLLFTILGVALGAPSTDAHAHPAATGQAAAGGSICIDLAWATAPARAEAGFVLANRGNTVWRGVFIQAADSRGMACEAELPAGRYLVCEVAYGGYAIQPLPAPGQTASETCVGLTLGDGEAAQVAFQNASLAAPAVSLPGLPNTGAGGMAAQP